MGSFPRLSAWVLGAAFVLAIAACAGRADAQSRSATPLDSPPTVPRTVPLLGTGQPSGGDTLPLVAAAAANDALAVDGLLDARLSPDEAEGYGRTALIYAAMNNNADIAQTLVNRGAKLDIRDNLGKTALHWAAERGSIRVMRVLLQAHAAVDVQSRQGLTPLMLAANSGRTDAVRLLLQYHADTGVNDFTGRNALSWAESHPAIVQVLKADKAH